MRKLTYEEEENKKWWEAITNTLTVQYGSVEEPARILTFNELKNLEPNKTYVWLEDLIQHTIKGCEILSNPVKDNNIVSIFSGGYYSLLRKNYGKKYQCWSAYPSDRKEKILLLHQTTKGE